MASPPASGIIPAQLGFLAIYNPSLGTTDETVDDQIVYYASASSQSGSKRRRHRTARDGRPTDSADNDDRNERLRQIGLAQGMVDFGRSFSAGKPVDSIDTERTRVVLHELEPGWWILASIDLTRIPLSPSKTSPPTPSPSPPPATTKPTTTASSSPQPATPESEKYDYTTRDVKPPHLLLADLLRAHALFTLHHGPFPSPTTLLSSSSPPQQQQEESTSSPSQQQQESSSSPSQQQQESSSSPSQQQQESSSSPSQQQQEPTTPSRQEFTSHLARYWDSFLATWHVLLHGNPAGAVFGGIKMAGGGELGVGVGEEERGSGERSVLEGLAERVGGLGEVVVGRFGNRGKGEEEEGWLGRGNEVGADDGIVFLGVGALSRRSLRSVAWWMEDIYTWGEGAYGVVDSAGAGSRPRRRRAGKKGSVAKASTAKKDQKKGKPKGADRQAGDVDGNAPPDPASAEPGSAAAQPGPAPAEDASAEAAGGGMDKMFSYLKLGYGTYWSLGTSPATNSDADDEPIKRTGTVEGGISQERPKRPSGGYFLVGLDEQKAESKQPESPGQATPTKPRTITVELAAQDSEPDLLGSPNPDTPNQDRNPKTANLRPVVYVHRPFIYILLFDPTTTPQQPWPELAHSLHTQLTPLHKPLLTSTAYRPEKPTLGLAQNEIYDLVFDPSTLTIHSTIPNIPDPLTPLMTHPPASILSPPPPPSSSRGTTGGGGGGWLGGGPTAHNPPPWSRADALNTHAHILNLLATTRTDPVAVERTCKTGRGWWVVWNCVVDQGAVATVTSSGGSSPGGYPYPGGLGFGSGSGSGSDGGAGVGAGAGASEDDRGEGNGDGLTGKGKEILLVRRASDHGGGSRNISASYVGGGAGGWADGASRLAQGIGVDTRRYVEGLLSLDR